MRRRRNALAQAKAVSAAIAEVLPVAIAIAVQFSQYKGACPDPAHLFIEVLAKVGYV
jgi:hypothetical protein